MIRVTNLKISYQSLIFENVNFLLGNAEKVGLVGLNGSGKSTLLKILAGIEKADSGSISLSNEKIAYLPQEYSFDENLFLGEFLESLVNFNTSEVWRVNKILSKLEFEEDEFRTIGELSPGQKMKLYLAKILIDEPTILLLDEPTNHLDIEGIMWLEGFIKNFKGICIMVSHDRAFLNNITNRIFEMDEKTLRVFEGNYDGFIEGKLKYLDQRSTTFKLQEQKRQQLEKLLENARKIKDSKKRSKAVSSAKKRMEREVTSKEISKYQKIGLKNLDLKGHVHDTKKILNVKALSFSYDKNSKLLEDVNLEVFGKERIWFYGKNGIGKSTFIKLLTGEILPNKGTVDWGENIKFAYFSQNQTHLPMDQKLIDYVLENTDRDSNTVYAFLQKFLFDKSLYNSRIGSLSPGQRARLSFAVFSAGEYECLILDEPTNHLDIETKEKIEETLNNYKGAIIYISHDRYFAENLNPGKVITIEDRTIVEI